MANPAAFVRNGVSAAANGVSSKFVRLDTVNTQKIDKQHAPTRRNRPNLPTPKRNNKINPRKRLWFVGEPESERARRTLPAFDERGDVFASPYETDAKRRKLQGPIDEIVDEDDVGGSDGSGEEVDKHKDDIEDEGEGEVDDADIDYNSQEDNEYERQFDRTAEGRRRLDAEINAILVAPTQLSSPSPQPRSPPSTPPPEPLSPPLFTPYSPMQPQSSAAALESEIYASIDSARSDLQQHHLQSDGDDERGGWIDVTQRRTLLYTTTPLGAKKSPVTPKEKPIVYGTPPQFYAKAKPRGGATAAASAATAETGVYKESPLTPILPTPPDEHIIEITLVASLLGGTPRVKLTKLYIHSSEQERPPERRDFRGASAAQQFERVHTVPTTDEFAGGLVFAALICMRKSVSRGPRTNELAHPHLKLRGDGDLSLASDADSDLFWLFSGRDPQGAVLPLFNSITYNDANGVSDTAAPPVTTLKFALLPAGNGNKAPSPHVDLSREYTVHIRTLELADIYAGISAIRGKQVDEDYKLFVKNAV
jgi:hypothetical protein